LATLALLVACGDDESADDKVCDAREDLDENVRELSDVGTSTSVDDLEDTVGDIREDLSELGDANQERLQPQVDDLRDALGSTLSDLPSSDSLSDALDSVESAVGNVTDAAGELSDKAKEDCNN